MLGPGRERDAEDVAQEAFVQVYRRLASVEARSRFSTWLYRIARRQLRHAGPGHARSGAWRTWMLRLYWVMAAAVVARYWRAIELTPMQLAVLALVGAAVVVTLRRASRMGPLTRVLRDAIWH